MIRLNLSSEPTWVDLGHGVEVLIDPIGSMVLTAAGRSPAMQSTTRDLPKEANFAIFTVEVAKLVIRDWRGVAGEDGEPAPVDAAHVEALLALHPIYKPFEDLVARAMVLVTEKNG